MLEIIINDDLKNWQIPDFIYSQIKSLINNTRYKV